MCFFLKKITLSPLEPVFVTILLLQRETDHDRGKSHNKKRFIWSLLTFQLAHFQIAGNIMGAWWHSWPLNSS